VRYDALSLTTGMVSPAPYLAAAPRKPAWRHIMPTPTTSRPPMKHTIWSPLGMSEPNTEVTP